MHKTLIVTIVLGLVLPLSAFAQPNAGPEELASPAAPSAAVDITILHTNDVHGHVDEYDRDGSDCKPYSPANCIAGAARLATAIEQVRTEVGEANTLLVDAGDQSLGGLYYYLFKSEIVTATMNPLGYDAMAVGNHEFDLGPAELATLIGGANFPILSANIDASAEASLAGKIEASTIVTKGGEPIGIVGLTTPETAYLSSPGADVVFNDPAASLQAAVNALAAQGVDKIIALTHMGYAEDLSLAAVITGVDVIVGGHSHTFIYTPTTPITFTPPVYPKYSPLLPEGPYPTVVNAADGNPVLVVTDYQWGTFLGRLDVSFDDQGLVTAYAGNPIFMANTIVKDPAIEAILTPTYKVPVEQLKATLVGTTTVDLPIDVGGNTICRLGECLMGNLVADAMLWKVNSIDPGNQYQIAIQNGGGLRAPLIAGPVTFGDVIGVLPFGNSIATFEITGANLILALENGVSRYPDQQGRFPQIAGMRFTWSPSLAVGSRILSAEVLSGTQYIPLNPTTIYKVVTNDYVRKGGDGYSVFGTQAINPYDFGPALEQAVKEYLEQFSPVTPQIEGRIKMLDKVLTILHTNDIHGTWPETFYGTTPEGMVYLASHIKAERAKNPNTILLDAGDTFQGNAFAQYFRNATPSPIAGGLNLLDYDAMVLGNHEYNFGRATFASMLGQVDAPILGSANVDDDGAYGFINDNVKDYITLTVGGIDVAIFGLTNPRVPRYELPSNIPGLTFSPALTATKNMVSQIVAGGKPDVLVGLTHIGYRFDPRYPDEVENDEMLAQEVPGIDVIVGAHSHTRLMSGAFVTSTINPTGTLIGQAAAYAQYLGKITIGLSGNDTDGYKIESRQATLLEAKDTTTDAEMSDYLAPFVITLTNYTQQVIGYTTTPIDARTAFTEETSGGNLQADAAVYELTHNGVDVDVHLSGAMSNKAVALGATPGLRAPSAAVTLTVGDMYTLMPYENSLVVLRMNGPQLKTVLQRSYDNYYVVPRYTTCFLDTDAGNQIVYEHTAPDGNNVISLKIQGQPVDFTDADTYYNVSTVNYLAAGSCSFNDSGQTLWPLGQMVTDTQFYVRDAVIDYLKAQTAPVAPVVEGRVQFIAGTPDLSTSSKAVVDASGDDVAQDGEVLTYTITIVNSGTYGAGFILTDTLPAGLSYEANSLSWDLNLTGFSAAFTGNTLVAHTQDYLEPDPAVGGSLYLPNTIHITFAARVDTSASGDVLTNTIQLQDQFASYTIAPATIPVQTGYTIFLPVIFKNF
ncbi:MAG: 5'-nucleotidase C-terminal domain-containing protein [Thermoflexales bacterium]|nr:5'-nucleotidase C-terminal domain-containing protein [Thermoflexales bacterium]